MTSLLSDWHPPTDHLPEASHWQGVTWVLSIGADASAALASIEPRPTSTWASPDGTIAAAWWCRSNQSFGPRQPAPGEALAIVSGRFRRRNRPWESGEALDRFIRGQEAARHPSRMLAELCGEGSIVRLDAEGDGFVTADAFGLQPVHVGQRGRVAFISSSSRLVSQLLGAGRDEVDADALAWYGLAGHLLAGTSPWNGVERLIAGSWVQVGRGGRWSLRDGPGIWYEADLDHLDESEVLGYASSVVQDHVVQLAAAPVDGEFIVDLTGGKDSRLVATQAVRALGSDHVVLQTVGLDGDPEVEAARRVAEAMGVDLRTGIPARNFGRGLVERTRWFSQVVEGSSNIWHATAPHDGPMNRRLSGTGGEVLRHDLYEARWLKELGDEAPTPSGLADSLVTAYARQAGGLLTKASIDRLRCQLAELLDRYLAAGVPPRDLGARYYVDHIGPKLGGIRWGIDRDLRVMPLLDPVLMSCAYWRGGILRRRDGIHRGLVAAASVPALHAPLLKGAWAVETPVASMPVSQRVRPSIEAGPVVAETSGRSKDAGWSTLARARATPSDERRDLLVSLLRDPGDAVRAIADMDRVRQAVEDFATLPMGVRLRLYGLASIAGLQD